MRIRQRTLTIALLATLRAGSANMLPELLPAALAAAGGLAAVSAGMAPTTPAHAAERGDALSVLIAQGKYWQDHRRGDLAEQAWQKVLRIDPKQADALCGMGVVEADRKRPSQAQEYLVQLRDAAPNDPRIDELARRLGESTPGSAALDDARRLAQQGQAQAAVQEYQEVIGKGPVVPG